jgi:hypothetical protein
MDELIRRLVAETGLDRPTVEKAVGIIFDFLVKETPADKIRPLFAMLPGADALVAKVAAETGGGMVANAMAGVMGGIMGAGMRMMSAGLSMEQAQRVAKAVLAFTREKAGDDAVGKVVAAIPGLAQFV